MPWHIEKKGDEFCVIKDSDGSSAGCHPSREKANAQMRALYSKEPSVNASLELDTNDLFESFVPAARTQEFYIPPPQTRIEVDSGATEMVEALAASVEQLAERLVSAEERNTELLEAVKALRESLGNDHSALVASLSEMTEAITAAVSIQPEIHVQVPEFPAFPEIPAPVVNVKPPEVNVTVEQPRSRSVNITRDPLTGMIASADISEI